MWIPGSEPCADLVQNGVVAKIADDLYSGSDTISEALTNWAQVQALHQNNLHLSASKTIIHPKSTAVLGWLWSQGTL